MNTMHQTTTAPLVSVVMPVLNGQATIRAAIESLLQQTLGNIEIVVVDDGSTDDTPAILAELAADSRLQVKTCPPRGMIAALNHGINAARADLIARLDADDLAHPTRLEKQYRAFCEEEKLVLLGTAATAIDVNDQETGRILYPTGHDALIKELETRNPFVHSSIMMRTNIVRAVKGYRPVFDAAEDYDLWLRISERGNIANLPGQLVSYRQWADSYSARNVIKGAYSGSIARRSAELRRETGSDPITPDTSPLDYQCEEVLNGPFGSEARFYAALAAIIQSESDVDSRQIFELVRFAGEVGRNEKRLAQDEIARLIKSGRLTGTSVRWSATMSMFSLAPMRSLRAYRKAA